MIHACTAPQIATDRRRDNQWVQPEYETRPRCVTCGWQGRWLPEITDETGATP